jgi:hypothetical protein
MIKESLYANEYPSWGQAPKALIEKQPQYPFYSLPFRGKSEYRENFNKTKDENNSLASSSPNYINKTAIKENTRYGKPSNDNRDSKSTVSKTSRKSMPVAKSVNLTANQGAEFIKQRQSNDIKLTSVTPVPHNFETTNQKEFQPF